MSVRGTLGGILASVAVLVVGWQIGAAALDHPTAATSSGGATGTGTGGSSGTGTTSGSEPGSPTSGSSGTSGSGTSGATTTSTLKDGSYSGKSVQTPYGDVQVAVTVSGGRITKVTTPILQADDSHSERINSQAAPLLAQEVLQAQSADVAMISGATFTSEGYLTSLQSALDDAG